jgi:hypothetical protein
VHDRDAAEYINALPKAEQDAADWLIAMETLSLVAERNAPEALSRIAFVMASEVYDELKDRLMATVWVYVDTSKQVGDRGRAVK